MIHIGSMEVKFSSKFAKQYDKSPFKIRQAFDNRLKLFLGDTFHPLLNNHSLVGKYTGYRSINVTGDWRAIFHEFHSGELVYFEAIGTHSQLYR